MVIATLIISIMQVSVRYVGQEIHPFEIAFFRNFLGLIVVLPLLYQSGLGVLRTSQIKWHAARGVLQTSGMLMFWSIEELYKTSKAVIESFHAKSERGARQELYAAFTLITLARLFANRCDDDINRSDRDDQLAMRTSFKNGMHLVGREIEAMFASTPEKPLRLSDGERRSRANEYGNDVCLPAIRRFSRAFTVYLPRATVAQRVGPVPLNGGIH